MQKAEKKELLALQAELKNEIEAKNLAQEQAHSLVLANEQQNRFALTLSFRKKCFTCNLFISVDLPPGFLFSSVTCPFPKERLRHYTMRRRL